MKKFLALMLLLSLFTISGSALADDTGRSLIFYFDYSENIDTTGLDVDAISQASMAGTRARDMSNLLVMVDVLKERTNADVYSLRVAELYAPGFGEMIRLDDVTLQTVKATFTAAYASGETPDDDPNNADMFLTATSWSIRAAQTKRISRCGIWSLTKMKQSSSERSLTC